MKSIRFKFSPEKARIAVHWMLSQGAKTDLHAILKACYFADKKHLNDHGRPIFGATYRAMKFGPVPIEIYEMLKGDPIWLADMETDRYPWILDGFRLQLIDNSDPDINGLSESNLQLIRDGFEKSCKMTFSERTKATHGSDWQAARLGFMSYEDMLEETEDKADRIAYLRESAPYMKI